jgi:hypothetical protein
MIKLCDSCMICDEAGSMHKFSEDVEVWQDTKEGMFEIWKSIFWWLGLHATTQQSKIWWSNTPMAYIWK